MLFTKSIVLAVTAFGTISFGKPVLKAHGGAEVAARATVVSEAAKRGLPGLPINIPSTPVPDTIPAILVNLDTSLGSLMTGDLSELPFLWYLRSYN